MFVKVDECLPGSLLPSAVSSEHRPSLPQGGEGFSLPGVDQLDLFVSAPTQLTLQLPEQSTLRLHPSLVFGSPLYWASRRADSLREREQQMCYARSLAGVMSVDGWVRLARISNHCAVLYGRWARGL